MTTSITLTGTGTVSSPNFAGTGTVSGTAALNFTGPFLDPAALSVIPFSVDTMDLSWPAAVGATSYTIEFRAKTPGDTVAWSTPIAVSGSTLRLGGLTPGVLYDFRLKAIYGPSGTSPGLVSIAATPDVSSTPGAVSNIRTVSLATTSADIAWDAALNAQTYKLWIRETSGGSYGATPNALPSGLGYSLLSLVSSTGYTVKIVGTANNVDGPAVEFAFTTASGALGDPASVTASGATADKVDLTWPAGVGAASYVVDWKVTGAANYGLPVDVAGRFYTVTGLTAGTGYTFRVRSRSGTSLSTGVTTTSTTLGTSSSGGGGGAVADVYVGNSGTGSSLAATKPAATAGQTYWLAVVRKSKATAATTPAGFTLVQTVTSTDGAGEMILYKKTSAGEIAGTITLAFGASVDAQWMLLLTSKAQTVTPTFDENAFSTSAVVPSITPTAANSTVVDFVATAAWPRNFTPAAGMAAQGGSPISGSNGPSLYVAAATFNAGATGTRTYTLLNPDTGVATGDDYMAIALALDGSAAGGGTGTSGNAVASTNVAIPAANSGDTQYIALSFKDATVRGVTTPSGWTLVTSTTVAVGKLVLFSRAVTADVGASTQNVAFTGGTANVAALGFVSRGAFRASAVGSGASATTGTCPTVTAVGANSTWLQIFASAQFPRTFTQPAGVTLVGQKDEAVSGPAVAVGYKSVGNGATGASGNWTLDTSDDWLSISVALDAPVGSGAGSGDIFYFGSHQHGNADNTDRFAAGAFPGNINTMESFNFGAIRTHDVEAINCQPWWTGRTGGINGAGPNVYDWSLLDRWTDKVVGRGHKILLTFFGNPTWASRRPTDASVYGDGRTAWVPNKTAWRNMVADTVAHVIARHGAASLVAGEVGNEPIGGDDRSSGQFFNATSYAPGNPDQVALMYADFAEQTYLGIRDSSGSLPVLLGAHTYQNDTDTRRLMGARTSGGTAITSFGTAWSFHPYGLYDGNGVSPSLTEITARMRSLATEYGTGSWDFWATEVGLYYPWESQKAGWWEALSIADRAFHLQQWGAAYKALRYRAIITYSSDGNPTGTGLGFLGDPEVNSAIRTALNDAYASLNKES